MEHIPCEKCGTMNKVSYHFATYHSTCPESQCDECNERKAKSWDALMTKLDAVKSSATASNERLVSGDEFLSYAISLRAELENDDGKRK